MKAKVLLPVPKQSVESQTTEHLRDYILSGLLPPGARLKEIELAEKLQVARATLRTSLMRLKTEGIIIQIPYTGWQVMDLTPDDVWELWTLRGSLESLASKLAAERMNTQIRNSIELALQNLIDACNSGDVRKASDADFALHRTIIDSVGHRRLAEQYRQVEQQVLFYIVSSNELVGDNLSAIVHQHDLMMDALLSRDPIRAAQEAWNHNESEGGKLVAALRRRQKPNSNVA